jgi:hypothetical protein
MRRFLYLVAVGVIFASVIGCAHKKAKRYTSGYYADCCSPCCCCDGVAGPINGFALPPGPGPVIGPPVIGAAPAPGGRVVRPTALDATSTAALSPASTRR